jgi:hypothetical protein
LTSGGGGRGVTGSVSLLRDAEQAALIIDPNVTSDAGLNGLMQSVGEFMLLDEEGGAHGGRAIRDHLGKADGWLRERLQASYEAFIIDPWKRNAAIFFRDTFGAAVIVVHNRNSGMGYSITSAFPIFD